MFDLMASLPKREPITPKSMGVKGPAIFGITVFVLFFGGLGAWGAFAPLESAAIAQGYVAVEGNRKQVQHLEGGIIAELFVREGETVERGRPLVHLDETQARANLEVIRSQLRASVALEARLIAERDNLPKVSYPDWLIRETEERADREVLDAQDRIFSARVDGIQSQTRILKQRSGQIEEEIRGLQAELKAQGRSLALIREEEQAVGELVAKGLERKPRLLGLQRQVSELEGAIAQNVARIARARQAIGENELKIIDLRIQILNDASQKLREEQVRISDLTERRRAAEDMLTRTMIVAPTSGRVVNLKTLTVGGVVVPRDTIMDIIPQDDTLIVEAQVAPGDIDVVKAGLPVQLRFTALNQRSTPIIMGQVTTVSADRQIDQRSGNPYFTTRISIDPVQPGLSELVLYPGMPAEAMIITGRRTALQYLIKPISSSMGRAMRED